MLVPLKSAQPRHSTRSKAWRDFLEEEQLYEGQAGAQDAGTTPESLSAEGDAARDDDAVPDTDSDGAEDAPVQRPVEGESESVTSDVHSDDLQGARGDSDGDEEASTQGDVIEGADEGAATDADDDAGPDMASEQEKNDDAELFGIVGPGEVNLRQGRYRPHFDSAIPMGEDRFGVEARSEGMPRMSAFLVAAAASLVIIGGTTLLITHPWDQSAFQTRATDEKDVSSAGYPGEVGALSGQDSDAEGSDKPDKDASAFNTLTTSYAKLGELRKSLGENEDLLITAMQTDEATLIEGGYSEAESATIELASIQTDLSSIEMQTSSYKAEAESLKELATWLRDWSEALVESWSVINRAYSPSYAETEVMDILYGGEWYGTNAQRKQFDENYVNRFPVEHRQGSTATSSGAETSSTTSSTTTDSSASTSATSNASA